VRGELAKAVNGLGVALVTTGPGEPMPSRE